MHGVHGVASSNLVVPTGRKVLRFAGDFLLAVNGSKLACKQWAANKKRRSRLFFLPSPLKDQRSENQASAIGGVLFSMLMAYTKPETLRFSVQKKIASAYYY
jgi:hypothetical protein